MKIRPLMNGANIEEMWVDLFRLLSHHTTRGSGVRGTNLTSITPGAKQPREEKEPAYVSLNVRRSSFLSSLLMSETFPRKKPVSHGSHGIYVNGKFMSASIQDKDLVCEYRNIKKIDPIVQESRRQQLWLPQQYRVHEIAAVATSKGITTTPRHFNSSGRPAQPHPR